MSEQNKVKGIKTGFILLMIVSSFILGLYLDDEFPIVWACITAEGL